MANSEEWRPVVGYEGLYLVSESGVVKSLWSGRGSRGHEYLLAQIPDSKGYFRVGLTNDELGQKWRRVHILVAQAFVGPRPAGLQLNHRDGNKTNNHWSNLEYVTASENSTHAVKMGLRHALRGSAHKMSKLTEEQVKEIRERYVPGANSKQLAREFGIDQSNVWLIGTREAWAHLE